MSYTNDPVADYDRYCAEQERRIARLPRCSECDNHITTECAYYINGEWICEECMDSYRQPVPEE